MSSSSEPVLPPETQSSVAGVLRFLEPPAEHLFDYRYDPPPGSPQANVDYKPRSVPIENARGILDDGTLDLIGAALVVYPSKVRDFWDEAQTLALGHPEIAQLVKTVTGAQRVVVFDHTRRRRSEGAEPHAGASRQPVPRVHADQTHESGPQRVRDILGEEAELLLRSRAAIINVWRPIHHPARDWPLAICDARTVDPKDRIRIDLIFAKRTGANYGILHNPHQRWLYVSDLQVNEALLIKSWDSDPAVARFTPHTAFEDPTPPIGTPPRESIEFRTIAFF
jgi:hypothetical protein